MEGDAIIMVPLLQQQAAEEEEQIISTKKPELRPTVTSLNSNEDLYANLPLPPHSRSIRLIDLDPPPEPGPQLQGQDNDGIPPKLTGRLRVVKLQDSPSFTALSYVWGASLPSPSPYRISISLNNSTTKVTAARQQHQQERQQSQQQRQEESNYELDLTKNCHQALSQIRNTFGSVTIWVDSVCINQSVTDSNNEKATQIPLMEDIYMLAESVYVWLGEGDDESDRIMRYIKQRACLFQRLPLGVCAAVTEEEKMRREEELRERVWRDFDHRIRVRQPKLGELRVYHIAIQLLGPWVARDPTSVINRYLSWRRERARTDVSSFDAVLGRGWIGRAWTFQEIILASNPVILCGTHSLTWDELVSTIYTHRDYENNAPNSETSAAVMEHWLSIVELWLSLPRPYHAHNLEKKKTSKKALGERQQQQDLAPSFREHLEHIRKSTNSSPWQLRAPHALFTFALVILVLVPYAYVTYKSGTSIALRISAVLPGTHWRSILGKVFIWFSYVVAWLLVTWAFYSVFGNMFNILDIVFFGRGALREFPNIRFPGLDPGNPQELLWRGMTIALRERKCYDPHDKAFALFGVLKVCGAELSTPGGVPDYGLPVNETYRILWRDFFVWQPRGLGVLIFAGTRFPWYHGQPGGAPTVGASWALPWGFDVNQGPHWLVNRCGYAFDAYYRRYGQAGPLVIELLGPNHTRLKLKGQRIGTVVFRTQFRWAEPLDNLQFEALARGGDLSRLVKLWIWRQALREMNVDQEEAWASLLSDILSRRFKFREFRELCEILDQYKDLIPPSSSKPKSVPSSGQDDEQGRDAERHNNEEGWTELLHDVKVYLDPCLQTLLNEERGLFIVSTRSDIRSPVSASGHNDVEHGLASSSDTQTVSIPTANSKAGTGPVDTQIGDVVFVLAGVPVPMVLRPAPLNGSRQSGEHETVVYRIIGPAIVPAIVSGGPKALFDGDTGSILVPLPSKGKSIDEGRFEDVVLV